MEQKSYILPRIVDYAGDVSKPWYIVFYVWDEAQGRLVRKRVSGKINQQKSRVHRQWAAHDLLNKIWNALKSGATLKYTEPPKPTAAKAKKTSLTWPEAVAYVLDQKRGTIGRSRERSFISLSDRIKEFYGSAPAPSIDKVSSKDVNDLLGFIRTQRNLSPRTINEYNNSISTVFNYLESIGQVKDNPAKRIKKLRVSKGERNHPFTLEQIELIKQAALDAGDHQFVLFMMFSLYTLARPRRELRLLKIGDIRKGTIWIPKENAKTSEGRAIDIAPALDSIIEQMGVRAGSPDHYVFGPNGFSGPKPVGINYFYKKQRQYLAAAGIKDIGYTLYSFKHTGAVQAYLAGVDIKAIQHLIGHTTVQQTEEYMVNLGMVRKTGDALKNLPVY